MQNNPKKAEVTCPICIQNFIPEAFHIEKVIMDTSQTSRGVQVISDKEVVNKLAIKPSNHIRKVWITNCPHCNYVLRFIAEVAKKELKELEGRKISAFDEFGTKYFYNLFNYPKPYMDYADYMNEAIDQIKKKVQGAITEINIDEWGNLCRGFLTDKKIDSFKFLVRFYANLENYCNSKLTDYKEKDMYQKIKESKFPPELENKLDEMRKLRNKVVHESHELTQDDIELIKETFISFLLYIVTMRLTKLDLKSHIENIERDFIDKKGLLWVYKRYPHVDLGEKLKFQGYYEKFLTPLLADLGIPLKY